MKYPSFIDFHYPKPLKRYQFFPDDDEAEKKMIGFYSKSRIKTFFKYLNVTFFSGFLGALRLGLHLDRVGMASLLDISVNTYSKWEYSDRKPRQVIVLKIKKILRKKRQIQLIPLLDAVLKTNAIWTSLDTSRVFILPGTAAEDLVNPCFVEAWKRADNVVRDWLYDFHKES